MRSLTSCFSIESSVERKLYPLSREMRKKMLTKKCLTLAQKSVALSNVVWNVRITPRVAATRGRAAATRARTAASSVTTSAHASRPGRTPAKLRFEAPQMTRVLQTARKQRSPSGAPPNKTTRGVCLAERQVLARRNARANVATCVGKETCGT